jgi:RNA polymerase sigma-70 factor (ECF subfamily)
VIIDELALQSATELTGEAAELESFVRAHYPRLVRLAALVCRREPDAEDAVQAGLERAWRSRGSLREADRLRPWLDRIVVRESLRLSRRGQHTQALLGWEQPREIAVDGDARPSMSADWTAMRIEFERLSPDHRAVIALHLYAGYSLTETAQIVGVPLETARSRLRAAKERLRAQLGHDPR